MSADDLKSYIGEIHMSTRYLSKVPKKVPAGRRIVHNHVRPKDFTPDYPIGLNGFRAWSQATSDRKTPLVPCDCEWAPHLGRHYRVKLP